MRKGPCSSTSSRNASSSPSAERARAGWHRRSGGAPGCPALAERAASSLRHRARFSHAARGGIGSRAWRSGSSSRTSTSPTRSAPGAEGPTAIVFVHGLGGSSYSWWAQLAACEERGHRAIAYDQRGAGLSSKPPGPYSVELWARGPRSGCSTRLEVERADPGRAFGRLHGRRARRACGWASGSRAWSTIGGALRWRPEAGPVFEERVRLARAGRMDEIATTVARHGAQRAAAGATTRRCAGLFRELIASNDPQAYAEWSARPRPPADMVDPERVACPALACCGEHDPVTPPALRRGDRGRGARTGGRRSSTAPRTGATCEAPEAVNEILLGFARRNRNISHKFGDSPHLL